MAVKPFSFEGNTQYLSTGFEGTETNPGKIAVGMYNGMFAYSGWSALNLLAGELKNPSRFALKRDTNFGCHVFEFKKVSLS